MTNDATRHYDNLLAEHYSWMVGLPFEVKVAEQRDLLQELGCSVGHHGSALDLGAGPGYQSAALADLGFCPVLAVDSSMALLAELNRQKGHRPIKARMGDLRALAEFATPESAEAIVCMGDTLTHLETEPDVFAVFRDSFAVLQPGGLFVLTFRDYSIELAGLDRFIPVRSDTDRVMTCFLEYQAERVVVHDLIYVRTDGGWVLHKSSYPKLRLAPVKLVNELVTVGFEVTFSASAGRMWAITGRKPTRLIN